MNVTALKIDDWIRILHQAHAWKLKNVPEIGLCVVNETLSIGILLLTKTIFYYSTYDSMIIISSEHIIKLSHDDKHCNKQNIRQDLNQAIVWLIEQMIFPPNTMYI